MNPGSDSVIWRHLNRALHIHARCRHDATDCHDIDTDTLHRDTRGTVICQHRGHCNTLQNIVTHCDTLHHTAIHSNILHHPAEHCSTLHRTATMCPCVVNRNIDTRQRCAHYKHTATNCNTLQHTATHCVRVKYLTIPPRPSPVVLTCVCVCVCVCACVCVCVCVCVRVCLCV